MQILGVVNLDISKTYHSTWRYNIIISKLNMIICKGKIFNVITDFSRFVFFQVEANYISSDKFNKENGVP